MTEAGELFEKRMRTERERLTPYFKDRPPSRILIEASTISEWVARLLEELGHQVVVAADHRSCAASVSRGVLRRTLLNPPRAARE